MRPYLTLERAREVADLVRRTMQVAIGTGPGSLVRREELEQLLDMALDAPRVRGREARATWSAYLRGVETGQMLELVAGRPGADERIGCSFDRYGDWRRNFHRTDPDGDR